MNPITKARALAAIEDLKAYVATPPTIRTENVINEEARQLIDALRGEADEMKRWSAGLVLALLSDEYTPAKLFAPWASISRIRQWRDDPKVRLDVIVRHGKLCTKPSAFFAHWRKLP